MKNFYLFIVFFLFFTLLSNSAKAQETAIQNGLDAINKKAIEAQLEFLSSNWMEGRATGEKGEFIAADYLASMLQFMGIDPAGDKEFSQPTRAQRWAGVRPQEYNTYFQNIPMIKYIENNSQISLLINNSELTFQKNIDYSISSYSNNISYTAAVVFVGYGFTDEKSGYDDYRGIDIKNKIIIRLSGYPGSKDIDSEGYKRFSGSYGNDYMLERNKNKKAMDNGALAVIAIADQEETKNWAINKDANQLALNEKPFPKIYNQSLEIKTDSIKNELMQIWANPTMINKLLENTGINITRFEKKVASTLKPESKIVKDAKLKISINNTTELINTRNVLGVIEGENKDEIIVIGGHYDHLGTNDGFVWNGADDNASGTVGVWMLAKAFAASGVKPRKTIVFAAWTGEERGLLGSKYFTDKPYGGKIDQVKLYVNYDMISKDSPNDSLKNQARLVYTKSFEKFETMSAKNITDYNLNLKMIYRPSENPRGGSDHSSFSAKNVPIMYFMAGFPADYHTPTDETDDINWNKMVDIIKLTFLNVWEIANE
ncbi:MAG: hypothetical protein A2W99_08430 [Bacteroidetes bacterium GWF2_33_16]|nr:MAG: hypothetical protein A2X00_00725 [Bacteroidetes bacterium GWE2_32_14]OFY05530.1 MAG: hypothetical protein A2W99_08430 [Bacteroidetes bacterium GWF2_33_16]OFZ01626.1 MAG: hypothetical protein A2491_20010 [Bacteroidetes bacterium RIFOXYC12_FULL_35_7]